MNSFRTQEVSLNELLRELVGMTKAKLRTPRIGDRVTVAGRDGVFIVEVVRHAQKQADIRLLKGADNPVETGFSWEALIFLDEQKTW